MGNRYIPSTEPIPWSERFRIPMTMEDAVNNYKQYQKVIRDSQKAIKDSSDVRAYLNKNIKDGDPWKLLRLTCECIAQITGDTSFGQRMDREIENREKKAAWTISEEDDQIRESK